MSESQCRFKVHLGLTNFGNGSYRAQVNCRDTPAIALLAGLPGVKISRFRYKARVHARPWIHLHNHRHGPVARVFGRRSGSPCRGTASAAPRRPKRRRRRSWCRRRGREISATPRWGDTKTTKFTTMDLSHKGSKKCNNCLYFCKCVWVASRHYR